MPISAEEASQIIQKEQRKLNDRHIPKTPSQISNLMKENMLSVCNVGPWPHICDRPGLYVQIPAYDAAKDPKGLGYAASEPLPSIHRFAKIVDEYEMTWCEDNMRDSLMDLIGVGPGLPRQQALIQYGVFVPEKSLPNAREVGEANRNLNIHIDRLIEEARDAYDKGPEERKSVIDPNRHLLVARMRGINEPWVHHKHTEQSVRCRNCGQWNPEGVAICKCGIIIDFKLHAEIMEEQERKKAELANRTKK